MKRALVLGLLVGVAAGCGGSQPDDTAQQTPKTATDSGGPAARESAPDAPVLEIRDTQVLLHLDGQSLEREAA